LAHVFTAGVKSDIWISRMLNSDAPQGGIEVEDELHNVKLESKHSACLGARHSTFGGLFSNEVTLLSRSLIFSF
jgi:hypothetical protein